MAQDQIRYDLHVQEALRGVVRKVLTEVAREGLPGDHHFYISFRTNSPGVRLSARMRERYPDDMTIVLQHQFWDLTVTDQGFEVGLSFSTVPERLVVPFDAVTGFFDPSVDFGLKFEMDGDAVADPDEDAPGREAPSKEASIGRLPARDEAAKPGLGGTRTPAAPAKPAPAKPAQAKAPGQPAANPAMTGKKDGGVSAKPPREPAEADASAEVVSLDAFRKKP
ncbi:SspB family protein [Chelatococcus sp. GCM10030263]|uniref:SspB family protein n=1 Tax=Chelatococcus sp. GCM10030263 TaxID=3273387 RepID=UPI0036209772